MKKKNDIHPANPRLPRPGTYALIEEEEAEELQNMQTSLSRHDHRKTWTCNCCCSNLSHEDSAIPLPWVSRLAKLNGKGRGKGGEVAAATKHVWWLTYEYKNKVRSYANGRKLVMIKK